MRDAHQGVPVASLPTGATLGGLFSGLFGGGGQAASQAPSQAPRPPASIQPPVQQRQNTGTASLDGFMIDNLFGRRRD